VSALLLNLSFNNIAMSMLILPAKVTIRIVVIQTILKVLDYFNITKNSL